jgi:hypothetical protein
MRRNTIVFDSEGFTAVTQLSKLRGNLVVLKYLYSLADLTLFFVPSNNLSLVANQIPMLELSIMYAVDGEKKFGQAFQKLTTDGQVQNTSVGVGDIFGMLSMLTSATLPHRFVLLLSLITLHCH